MMRHSKRFFVLLITTPTSALVEIYGIIRHNLAFLLLLREFKVLLIIALWSEILWVHLRTI
jgi:hypothetical protein